MKNKIIALILCATMFLSAGVPSLATEVSQTEEDVTNTEDTEESEFPEEEDTFEEEILIESEEETETEELNSNTIVICSDCGKYICECDSEESIYLMMGAEVYKDYTDAEEIPEIVDEWNVEIIVEEIFEDEEETEWYHFIYVEPTEETLNNCYFVKVEDTTILECTCGTTDGEHDEDCDHYEEEDILDDIEEEPEDDDVFEGEFQSPIDFTNVAEIMEPIKEVVEQAVYSVKSFFSANDGIALTSEEGDEEEGDDEEGGDEEDELESDDNEEESDDDGDQEEETEDPNYVREDNPNIITSKTVTYNEDDGYTLHLESYLMGEPTITTDERIPSDIVIVLDQSGSMDDCFYCADDKADSLVKVYSGLSLTTRYYVKKTSTATSGTAVYYCDSGDACKYVDSSGNKKTHTAGWFYKKHSTMTTPTDAGTRYYASAEDSPSWNARVFYTKKDLSEAAAYNMDKSGQYWRSVSGVLTRIYYRNTCHAWFDKDKQTCNTTNHTKSTALYPDASSSDKGHRSVVFYHRQYKHTVTDISSLPSGVSYYIKKADLTSGDTYTRVYYRSSTKNWNTKNEGTGTAYDYTKTTIYYTCPSNRNAALTNALNLFLEEIYADSAGEDSTLGTEDDVKNRIAIVGFGSRNEETESGPPTNALLSYASSNSKTEATTIGYTKAETKADYYKKSLRQAWTANGQSVINSAVESLQMETNTETYRGIEMANKILENNPLSEGEERNRIMVVFTDGYPYSTLTDTEGITGNFAFANKAITNANTAKNTYGATIYSIGIFSGANASNMTSTCSYTGTNNTKRANKFMHLISSNYLSSTTLSKAYTPSDVNPSLKTGSSYYLSASTVEALNEIFKSIAQNISGGGAYITSLDKETEVRDVVSEYFTIPEGAEVSVYTEAFAGEDDGTLVWNDRITNDGSLDVVREGNQVTVTGFDFTENYVATDITNGGNDYRGRKLVIEIPIEINNDGGTALPTNVQTSSGIYQGTTCYENFAMPTVDIPTTVTVEKQTVGANIPKGKEFEFNIQYLKFDTYKDEASNDTNYLNAIEEADITNVTYELENEESLIIGKETGSNLSSVIFGSEIIITETAPTDYLVEYSLDDGNTWKAATVDSNGNCTITEIVTADMKVLVRNTLQYADLTIAKDGISSLDFYNAANAINSKKQSTMYRIISSENDIDMTVALCGNDQITIKNLPIGEYKTIEITDWSWRYTLNSITASEDKTSVVNENEKSISFELTPAGELITYTNNRSENKWLSGDCYIENIFK